MRNSRLPVLADDPLDPLHFGFVDLGNDDLDLLGAVLADGDFLLSAGVHAAGDGGDQLVHVDRSRPASSCV